jgi:glycosyltransferase involved in cell wall biosynthesis
MPSSEPEVVPLAATTGDGRLRVVVLSQTFPNPAQPAVGVFIRDRLRRVARHCELVVVAPVPTFPLNGLVRGRPAAAVPRQEWQDGLRVFHPRFFSVPRYLKWLDGVFYAVSLLPFLARLRRRFAFDLIDAHFVYPDGLAAVLLGRVFGCPVVVTLRGSIVRLRHYRLHRPQIRWALGAASRILAVSQSLKQVAIELGTPADRIRVVPNGVDAELFRPMDRLEARRALGLPPDRTILLSVGAIREGKGHHRIVGLLPELLRRRPDLLFVIVGIERPGDGFRPVLDALIDRLGVGPHVLVAGERPHEQIPVWMAAADLCCLATRSEGWANVLLEAQAAGRPVVTTRVGGNAEIVNDASLGILVPPADDPALARAIVDALDRRWDPHRIAGHARAHSWDAAALAVAEEFRALVPERPVVGHPRPDGTPAQA